MANPTQCTEQTQSLEHPPRGKRRWVKIGAVLLVLAGVGTAAAFHFLKPETKPTPVAEYEKPNITQAAAKEEAAKTKVENDEQALEAARTALQDVQAEWNAAQQAKDQAEQNVQTGPPSELAEAKESLEVAERQFAVVTKKLTEAKAQLKAAENKLKTAEQIEQEAKAERERVEKLITQAEANRQALLGKWKRSDYYGDLTLELKDEGQAMMTIHFNTATAFFVGTKTLEMDIKWEVAQGNHLIFDSLRGRPEKAFQYVTVTQNKGTHRDEVLTHLDEKTFTTHDANNEKKVRTWTRYNETE